MSRATTKACPFCAETIRAAATLCRFCGRELPLPGHAAVLPAPVTPAPLAEASGAMPLRQSEVLDLLTALVQKSLVVYEEDEQGHGRYRLLETVRQYARDRLAEAGEGKAVRERHGAFCLQLAEAACAAASAGQGAEALERLEPEHDNLRAALAWSDGREAAGMLRLAGALGEFWLERGDWDEGRQWLERGLAGAASAEPSAERARALVAAGRIAAHQRGNPAAQNQAWSWLEEGVALFRLLGDTRGLIWALSNLPLMLRGRDPAAACVVLEEAVALARTVGDPRLLSIALHELAVVLISNLQAEFETARGLLEEGLALARQVGDSVLMAQSLEGLGRLSKRQGDGAKAREFLEESVELARAAKSKNRLLWALEPLVEVLSLQGDHERAKPLWEELLLLAHELRIPWMVGNAIAWLAPHDLSYEEALWSIDQAAREYGPSAAIHPLGALGHAARERGDYDRAATCYRRSLALSKELGDRFLIAQSLEDSAGLAARQQQWARAATLLGAAEGLCSEVGRTVPVAIPAEYERAVQGARGALGEAAFAAAWAAGRAMSVDEALAFALAKHTRT